MRPCNAVHGESNFASLPPWNGSGTPPAPWPLRGRRSGQVVRPIEPRCPCGVNANAVVLRSMAPRLLEWRAMNRPMRLGLAFVAAALHRAAPVAAYANASSSALPGDFCSASRAAPPAPAGRGIPLPASNEHHCAHAPCCAGGAVNAAAPPPSSLALLHIAFAGHAKTAANAVAAPVAPIAAAQARGPPHQA